MATSPESEPEQNRKQPAGSAGEKLSNWPSCACAARTIITCRRLLFGPFRASGPRPSHSRLRLDGGVVETADPDRLPERHIADVVIPEHQQRALGMVDPRSRALRIGDGTHEKRLPDEVLGWIERHIEGSFTHRGERHPLRFSTPRRDQQAYCSATSQVPTAQP